MIILKRLSDPSFCPLRDYFLSFMCLYYIFLWFSWSIIDWLWKTASDWLSRIRQAVLQSWLYGLLPHLDLLSMHPQPPAFVPVSLLCSIISLPTINNSSVHERQFSRTVSTMLIIWPTTSSCPSDYGYVRWIFAYGVCGISVIVLDSDHFQVIYAAMKVRGCCFGWQCDSWTVWIIWGIWCIWSSGKHLCFLKVLMNLLYHSVSTSLWCSLNVLRWCLWSLGVNVTPAYSYFKSYLRILSLYGTWYVRCNTVGVPDKYLIDLFLTIYLYWMFEKRQLSVEFESLNITC